MSIVTNTIKTVFGGGKSAGDEYARQQVELTRESNALAKRKEDLQAQRSRVAAIRAQRVALANAQVVGVNQGFFTPGAAGGEGSTFAGATAAYQTQFAANESFTNKINSISTEQIGVSNRLAEATAVYNKKMNKYNATMGLLGLAISGYGASGRAKAG